MKMCDSDKWNQWFSDIVHEMFNIEEILNIVLLGKKIDLKSKKQLHCVMAPDKCATM